MSSKITLLLITLLSLTQVWHNSKLASILNKPILRGIDYGVFSREFNTFILLAGFLLISLVFWGFQETDASKKKCSSVNWIVSFTTLLGLCAGLVLFINPDGRFPWNERKLTIAFEARRIKPFLYEKLPTPPEVVIFGSSISFTAPASYFKEKWGLNAFNMSVNGGGPRDFVYLLNYLIQKNPDGKAPPVILAEILSPQPRPGGSSQMPLRIIPYMPPDRTAEIFVETIDSLISVNTISDSIFTFLFVDTNRWQIWATLSDDGTAVRPHNDNVVSREIYLNTVRKDIPLMRALISCKELLPDGLMYIQKLVDLSRQHKISIVFYRTPINSDFYLLSHTKPDRYAQCKKKFDAYMENLTEQNSNIFFRDLSDYDAISNMGSKIYKDTHHLNPEGNTLVWQVLDKEIRAAIEWAKTNRK